jgi:hypothetical protein
MAFNLVLQNTDDDYLADTPAVAPSEPPQKKSRTFLTRNKDEIRQLVFDQDSDRNTEGAVRTLREFCDWSGRDEEFETLSKAALDSLLEDFYGNVTKQDGTSYHRNGFTGLRYGISRFMKKHSGVDITNDPAFVASESAYKARLVEMKKQGFGKVQHYPPIEEDDLYNLYASFDLSNPDDLRDKVQFDVQVSL